MAETILVVEDEALIGLQTENVLKRYGYAVELVLSGEEALEKLSCGINIDAVLMDIDLGSNRMNGAEAAHKIHEQYRLPVVFCSSHTDPATIQNTLGVHKYGYVQKAPGNEQFLISTLQMALELHATHSRLEQQEQDLQQENQLLQRFFEQSEALVAYLDRDFNFIRVNDKYAVNSHYRAEELVGQNHFKLYPNEENEKIFRQVVETGETYSVKAKPFQHPDQPERGTTYWDWTLSPVKDAAGQVQGLIFTLADVTGAVKEGLISPKLSQEKVEKWLRQVTEPERKASKLATIISALHEGLIIHKPDGSVESANLRAQAIFQMDEETLKRIYPLEGDSHTINEDGSPLPSSEHPVMLTARSGRPVYNKTIGLRRSSGEFVWISLNSIPFFEKDGSSLSGIVTTFRDVTIERSHKKQIESILDSIDSMVFVTDLYSYEIFFENAKMKELVGDVLGRPCHEVFCDKQGIPRRSCAHRQLFSGEGEANEGSTWEFQNERNGRWYRVFCKAIPWPGGPWGRLVIATDISSTKEHEKELEMLLIEMNHRVKNNLTHVIALSQLELQAEDKNKRTAIEDIVQRVRAIEILHNMLYSSHSYSTVEVGPYLEKLLASLVKSTISQGACAFTPSIEYDTITASTKAGTKLGLILAELVTNSVKYTDCSKKCEIRVSVRKKNKEIEYSYRDTGKGFDPNVRSLDDLKSGTGMMLLKTLAHDLKGSISVETGGPGAGFIIRFPAAELKETDE